MLQSDVSDCGREEGIEHDESIPRGFDDRRTGTKIQLYA